MRKRWIALGALATVAVVLFVLNASMFASPGGEMSLLAHRGVSQRFLREGLTDDTCTATRILPVTHPYLENTLPSMRAAFAAGADVVEIDVHPTTDGEFAVFHDWTLECRTNGRGVTREHSMTALRELDIGYGYTADGGRTFPFRGQGVGQMPTLAETLESFPDRRFLINFKGGRADEADLIVAYIERLPHANIERLAFYGAGPADRLRALRPAWTVTSRRALVRCARDYLLLGWAGHVSAACGHAFIFVPQNYAWLAWGWPNRFLARMRAVGSEVYISGAIRRGERVGIVGIDDSEAFGRLPRGWRGGVTTDAIEIVGQLARAP